jgi:hypothetical protein
MATKRVFYAHSSSGPASDMFIKVRDYIKEKKYRIDIVDVDCGDDSSNKDDMMIAEIGGCDLFVADITTNKLDIDNKPAYNSNVMIEIGYALRALKKERIMMIHEEKSFDDKKIPFFIRNRHIEPYEFDDIESVVDNIRHRASQIRKTEKIDEWRELSRQYPRLFYITLKDIARSFFHVRINRLRTLVNTDTNKVYIIAYMSNTTQFHINVTERLAHNAKYRFDLSVNSIVNDELKHTELLFASRKIL